MCQRIIHYIITYINIQIINNLLGYSHDYLFHSRDLGRNLAFALVCLLGEMEEYHFFPAALKEWDTSSIFQLSSSFFCELVKFPSFQVSWKFAREVPQPHPHFVCHYPRERGLGITRTFSRFQYRMHTSPLHNSHTRRMTPLACCLLSQSLVARRHCSTISHRPLLRAFFRPRICGRLPPKPHRRSQSPFFSH